jgi:Zn-dependent membrane protease YugP
MIAWFGPMFFDPMYFIIVAPGILLAIYASIKVKSTFARASQLTTRRGWTGRNIAQAILDSEGIDDVSIEPVDSYLGDHYDPRHKVLRLSPDVYNGRSVAAAGVAAHEVGHAIQDARGYAPLALRNSIVPVAGFGSNFSFIIIFIGLAMAFKTMVIVGCALFTMVVLFQLINLPVEFNASSRARQVLLANGLVTQQEDKEVGRVLHAAAMTYVAATLTAILTLLYYLMRAGLLGGRRND